MPKDRTHVFISYVRENADMVNRLCRELSSHGIQVWLDKNEIYPGTRWRQAIRRAIQDGSYFVACFSQQYYEKSRSYMNEELVEAIEILRQHHTGQSWFIPIKLSECEIPDRDIGAGETLQDLQYLDLHQDWEAGIQRLLSVLQRHKKKLSESLSFIIPMYNEEGMIGITLTDFVKRGYHERYKTIVCDDASTDGSSREARIIANSHDSISVIHNRPNGRKVGAIRTALNHVSTPFVLLMDADSMVNETSQGDLERVVERMVSTGLTAIGFKIRPPASNLIERLQRLEYLLFTDSIRRLLGVVVCLVGQGVIWNVSDLKAVLEKHSGIFEGDDLESTILATTVGRGGAGIAYETKKVIVTTHLKKTLRELVVQRSTIWDVGLIHTFLDTARILTQRGRHGAFFRGVFITEVLAHPFKLLAIPSVFLLTVFKPFLVSSDAGFLFSTYDSLYKLSIVTLGVLISTNIVYLALWALNMISAVYAEWPSMWRIALWVTYFTVYMATPFIFLLLTPMIPFVLGHFGDALISIYSWWGPAFFLTYAWWYLFSAILIIASSERWIEKWRLLVLGFLMPFYYVFLLVIPRTYGFAKYILGKTRGQYTPRKSSDNNINS